MTVPFLEGERVILRGAEVEDAELYLQCANHPEVRLPLFQFWPENIQTMTEHIRNLYNSRESVVLTIVAKETGLAIGHTALHRIDLVSRAALFAINIGVPSEWSKGYGSEVTRMMVEYGFGTLNLNRIQLHVWTDNVKGVRAYEKAGFTIEGTLRQAMYHDGDYCDFYVMGILRSEY
jgi:diamine N-acetyltransferase